VTKSDPWVFISLFLRNGFPRVFHVHGSVYLSKQYSAG
jgi:hypothetical protein